MKKKHRDIVVDGEKWAWRFRERDDYEQYQKLQVWKDKKIIYEKLYSGYSWNRCKAYKITPGLIARFIQRFLK